MSSRLGARRWLIAVPAMMLVSAPTTMAAEPHDSAASDATVPAAGDDDVVASSFVKFTVKDGDTTVAHPGFDAYHGEDTILEITMGDVKYEFKIFIERESDKKPYEVEVSLSRNGKTLIEGSKQKVPAKKKVEISGGSVSVEFLVDPHGALDKSRKKKIEGPSGDDPLD